MRQWRASLPSSPAFLVRRGIAVFLCLCVFEFSCDDAGAVVDAVGHESGGMTHTEYSREALTLPGLSNRRVINLPPQARRVVIHLAILWSRFRREESRLEASKPSLNERTVRGAVELAIGLLANRPKDPEKTWAILAPTLELIRDYMNHAENAPRGDLLVLLAELSRSLWKALNDMDAHTRPGVTTKIYQSYFDTDFLPRNHQPKDLLAYILLHYELQRYNMLLRGLAHPPGSASVDEVSQWLREQRSPQYKELRPYLSRLSQGDISALDDIVKAGEGSEWALALIKRPDMRMIQYPLTIWQAVALAWVTLGPEQSLSSMPVHVLAVLLSVGLISFLPYVILRRNWVRGAGEMGDSNPPIIHPSSLAVLLLVLGGTIAAHHLALVGIVVSSSAQFVLNAVAFIRPTPKPHRIHLQDQSPLAAAA